MVVEWELSEVGSCGNGLGGVRLSVGSVGSGMEWVEWEVWNGEERMERGEVYLDWIRSVNILCTTVQNTYM